ncbi:MAG: GNAT family N-acetyltransferase [Caldilineaceae bacterium]|nr:GNAT family N-acetyltransferase [Caldilineaceae bacterium]
MDFYPAEHPIPSGTSTDRLLLRPLRATDVELDYDAVISSAEQLRAWSQSSWPGDGFTLAENLDDLQRHEREHIERVAFTFTVLDPTASRCLGCVYLTAVRPVVAQLISDLVAEPVYVTNVGFWVRTSEVENGLDAHLLATLLAWLAADWRFDRAVFGISHKDPRQTSLLEEAGLERRSEYHLPERAALLALRLARRL